MIETIKREGVTMKQMCETIVSADFLRYQNGDSPTAEQIYNYSPTGELYMVFTWYEQAQIIIQNKAGNP